MSVVSHACKTFFFVQQREAGELSGSSSEDDDAEDGGDPEFHYRSNDCRIA